MKRELCAVLALAATASALMASEARPVSTKPAAAQPAVLEGYRRYEEPPLADWRKANDAAAAVGGHVGQIRGRAAGPGPDRESERAGKREARK